MSEERDITVAVSPAATREALLQRQARLYTQVRAVLVQLPSPDAHGSRASSLARFVSERKHRALVLELLLLGALPEIDARARVDAPPIEAEVWVRALASRHRGALTWSRSALSRAWADLEHLGLITRERRGRLVHVRPRREDGSADYTKPGGRKDHEHSYFVLPDSFWHHEWFGRLSLPGLAMLLLLLKETNKKPEVHFTFDQFERWYGIKRRTAQNGVKELRDLGLLEVRAEVVPSPLSGSGTTVRSWYSPQGDFDHDTRARLRAEAMSAYLARGSASKMSIPPSGATP